MKSLSTYVFASILSVSGGVSAFDANEVEREFDACLSQDSTTYGMERCANEFHQRWDNLLNQAYRELMTVLDEDGQQKLRDAQRAWIKFRDSEITNMDNIYSHTQGSMYIVVYAGNVMDITKARAMQLNGYLADLR
ncbi:hypothetical protein GCM10011348_15860 [Marinobacterium nitratireducens]|uniref:Lysozyme inhibitor LprI-like N-terminal domain-containing protein n=1 Tax=Marinobacterium nitratireducens TaxID=518897 RepID=A0A917ZBN2_9GAMM|nr:lysozyme inhibitor LprI family protein [Marinobacterium nitratireducens]GGO80046.1 hypothetical protein GCM10011348_15860 [Marinobacterium nitratireducens]